MGWGIRVLIIGLASLMLALLFLGVASIANPELENLAMLFVATFGVNIFIGLFALFLIGGKPR